MKVVILCGGQGTRLREETQTTPKPLLSVGGRPLLWHIMKLYGHYGFRDFVLCLGYRGQMIREYFLNYKAMTTDFTIHMGRRNEIVFHNEVHEDDFSVTLADTGEHSMTGSRVKQIEHFIDSDTFMVTYGDGLSDIHLPDLLSFHQGHGRIATVTSVKTVSRFGIIETNPDGTVMHFNEKPKMHQLISAGFFVFNREVFNYLSADPACVLESGPMQDLVADAQLMSYFHPGFFYAMDTYQEYLHLNELWNQGDTPWTVWKKPYLKSFPS
jgi:glucose-1-phosphate cytidylyltransferase